MFEPNIERVLEQIGEHDVVLDIGGWACPFTRANFVLDSGPYDTRGYYATIGLPASQGGTREHFSRATWIQRDICDRAPFPFGDKAIDFAICSHTLEDVRDPLWVCAEMVRVAKRGYIEVPSRIAESSRGWEHPRLAGLSHHRWLIDIEGNRLSFLHKSHMIHSHWRFSFPRSSLECLPADRKVQWLFWDDSFEWSERMIHGVSDTAAELEGFVRGCRPYSSALLGVDRIVRSGIGLGVWGWRGAMRRLMSRG